ncbi:MAG: hypothetical protein LAO05_06445 [Acidobacteriia bacterium]|nr:hypothetical protein [Terriglobia bacterium]
MVSFEPAPALPILAELKQASERWVRRERARARLGTGVAMLDEQLGGGWPQGKVGELVGSVSSGRSAVAAATVAAATARGEVTAWLDPTDAFDPASAAASGVDLARVLWVRPRGFGETVRAAELVLETGGFTVVVLDLGTAVRAVSSRGEVRERRGALSLRLARAVERASAVALVLAERPWAGTLAGATVVLRRGEVCWGGARGGPRWLEGRALKPQVERGGARWMGANGASGNSLPASAGGTGGQEVAGGGWSATGPPATDCAEPVAGGRWPAGRDTWSVDRGPWSAKTETAESSPEVRVIARSPGFTGATKQSRCSSPACGGGEVGVARTAACALTPALSRTRERVNDQGGDKPSPTTDETGVEAALGA